MASGKMHSAKELKNNMQMRLEIFFTFAGSRYMLAPNPDSPNDAEDWILVSQKDEDHPIHLENIDDALNYRLNGIKLKDQLNNLEDVDY